jgi:hypothetical protein
MDVGMSVCLDRGLGLKSRIEFYWQGDNDNMRIRRYIAKWVFPKSVDRQGFPCVLPNVLRYTINPAIVSGISHLIGSVEVRLGTFSQLLNVSVSGDLPGGKICWFGFVESGIFRRKAIDDLEGWSGTGIFFHFSNCHGTCRLHGAAKSIQPFLQIAWSQMGMPNASIPTPEPVRQRKMFGAYGKSPARNSILFVSAVHETSFLRPKPSTSFQSIFLGQSRENKQYEDNNSEETVRRQGMRKSQQSGYGFEQPHSKTRQ